MSLESWLNNRSFTVYSHSYVSYILLFLQYIYNSGYYKIANFLDWHVNSAFSIIHSLITYLLTFFSVWDNKHTHIY